jgi:hypothetical protein
MGGDTDAADLAHRTGAKFVDYVVMTSKDGPENGFFRNCRIDLTATTNPFYQCSQSVSKNRSLRQPVLGLAFGRPKHMKNTPTIATELLPPLWHLVWQLFASHNANNAHSADNAKLPSFPVTPQIFSKLLANTELNGISRPVFRFDVRLNPAALRNSCCLDTEPDSLDIFDRTDISFL